MLDTQQFHECREPGTYQREDRQRLASALDGDDVFVRVRLLHRPGFRLRRLVDGPPGADGHIGDEN